MRSSARPISKTRIPANCGPHHIDLKTGMYRGRQVLKVKTEA